MGGSGSGGGWMPPDIGDKTGNDSCDIRFQTDLFGPKADIIKTLKVADLLYIQLHTEGHSSTIAAFTSSGEIAGTITGVPQLGNLVRCLRDNAYSAEVVAISGSKVTVMVGRA